MVGKVKTFFFLVFLRRSVSNGRQKSFVDVARGGCFVVFVLTGATFFWLLGSLANRNALREEKLTTLISVLLECVLCNRLERLLNVDRFLGGRLEERDVSLSRAPRLEALGRDDALVLEVDLVPDDDEREVVRVAGRRLDEELVAPAVEVLECLRDVHVEHKDAAICPAVERDSQTLETLLSRCIPDLSEKDFFFLSSGEIFFFEFFFKKTGKKLTCMVTRRSSTMTSFVRKSAPMVALYWLENFLLTYWFISEVFPTLRAKREREKGQRAK